MLTAEQQEQRLRRLPVSPAQTQPLDIAWGDRKRHLDAVCEIEQRAVEYPWTRQEFRNVLDDPRVKCVVATDRAGAVLGYLVYERQRHVLHVLNVAVREQSQRRGVGSLLLLHVFLVLQNEGWQRIQLEVRERNLGAHLFLRATGFRCVGIHREHFSTGEDAYAFQYEPPIARVDDDDETE